MAYRDAQPERRAEKNTPPNEHVYEPLARRLVTTQGPGCMLVVPVLVFAGVAGVTGVVVTEPLAVALGLVAGVAAGFALHRAFKRGRARGVRFRVHEGTLEILFADRAEAISLEELEDVALDTHSVERVQDGSSLLTGHRAVTSARA